MRRLLLTFAALALVAAACASDPAPVASESTLTDTSAPSAEAPSTEALASEAPSLEEKGPITSADDMTPATEPSATSAPADEEAPPEATTAQPVASDLPAVDVIDLAGDATFNVASLVPSDRPIVLWFWAPH